MAEVSSSNLPGPTTPAKKVSCLRTTARTGFFVPAITSRQRQTRLPTQAIKDRLRPGKPAISDYQTDNCLPK